MSQGRSRRQIYLSGEQRTAGCACALNGGWFLAGRQARGERGDEHGEGFRVLYGSSQWGSRKRPHGAAAPAADSDSLPLDDSPAAEAAKAVAGHAPSIKTGDRVTTAGGIRGIIMSIKDDSIVIRVAPDNLKLEIAKSAIASVTTQEDASAS